MALNYCSQCGSDDIKKMTPSGDSIARDVCQNCQFVFYVNPKVVVGAVTTFNDLYLMCKRDIEPQKGFWTYPAGFLELNETPEQGAIRETFEEAQASIQIERLIGIYTLKSVQQVHLIYAAKMSKNHFTSTYESSEVKLVKACDIPWDDLAFPVIKWALKAHLDPSKQCQIDCKSTTLSFQDSLKYD